MHSVPATGRIHTHFHQLVASTGRLASSDPNLQNIPVRSEVGRRIRRAFVPVPEFARAAAEALVATKPAATALTDALADFLGDPAVTALLP